MVRRDGRVACPWHCSVPIGCRAHGAAAGKLTRAIRPPTSLTAPKCFPADTLISTAQGFQRIQDIREGDLVWAFDGVGAKWHLRPVLETFVFEYERPLVELAVAGETIRSTLGHPFWVIEGENLDDRPVPAHIREAIVPQTSVPGRWVDSHDLRPGDLLRLKDSAPARVTAIELRPFAGPVFNFAVDELHSYAVGAAQVLVHNQCDFVFPLDDLAQSAKKPSAASSNVGRGLGEIVDNPDLFSRFLKHKFPSDRPFSPADAKQIWDKLIQLGKNPRLDLGHPGTKWPGPHINVPGTGTHIPVDPGFTP